MLEENQAATASGEQSTEQGVAQENPEPSSEATPERTFKQSELDSIIKDRIARERQKFDSELKNNPHLSYLEQKAQRLGISLDQLIENDRKYEEQNALNELVQKNIPEEYAKEMLENRKFRKDYEADKEAGKQQENQRKMYSEFLEAYPDIKPEQVPAEVWQEVNKGASLLNAYTRYENKLLRDQISKSQQQQQTQQANEKNAGSSTGSAKSTGKPGAFFTREQVSTMTRDEIRENYQVIKESEKHWK
jgi:hypothetical protein